MNSKKKHIAFSDLTEGSERFQVVRYKGANAIKEMMKENQIIEAFVLNVKWDGSILLTK